MGMLRMGRIGRCANGGGGWERGRAMDGIRHETRKYWETEEFEHADLDQARRPALYRGRGSQHTDIRVRSLPVAAARWER